MCVTCYTPDPREVKLLALIKQPIVDAVLGLDALLCEASEESKASFFAALGRVFA
jgi:hypothetical protein